MLDGCTQRRIHTQRSAEKQVEVLQETNMVVNYYVLYMTKAHKATASVVLILAADAVFVCTSGVVAVKSKNS